MVSAGDVAVQAQLEVIPLGVQPVRLAPAEVHIEVDVLHDVGVVVAAEEVPDGEQLVHLVVNRQVTDVVHHREVPRAERGPRLGSVTLPAVLAVGVALDVVGEHLDDAHVVDVEVVHGIHVVAGVDEALDAGVGLQGRAELVDVVDVRAIVPGTRVRNALALDEQDVVPGVDDRMPVTDHGDVVLLLEVAAPAGHGVPELVALGVLCEVWDKDVVHIAHGDSK